LCAARAALYPFGTAFDLRVKEQGARRIDPSVVVAGGAVVAALLMTDRSDRARLRDIAKGALRSAIANIKAKRAAASLPRQVQRDPAFEDALERAKRGPEASVPNGREGSAVEHDTPNGARAAPSMRIPEARSHLFRRHVATCSGGT
jgi:hypothetical protein